MDVKRIAKFLTALAGALAGIAAAGLVDGDGGRWLSQVIGILTAIAVFLVPNEGTADVGPDSGPDSELGVT